MGLSQHRLDHYELQESLGSGSMSEVWKAFDTQQHRYVAIKILHINPQAAADLIPRFQREAQGLTALRHPNIARVFEVQASYIPGSSSSEAYMVMDYVEGRSLADYMETTSHIGNIPTPIEIVRLLAPVGAALDYAHQQGIIHGRLKPRSILLDKHGTTDNAPGEPRLVGFGMHTMQPPLTLPLDEVAYISPEMAQGNTENIRSDIYSLGVILYELCTGTLPFQDEQAVDVIKQHIDSTPTSPALINPRILPGLTAVIMRCLAKDPIARFPTASALVMALARALRLSVQDVVSQSGSVSRRVEPLPEDQWNTQNSPTYLSPLPQYVNRPFTALSSPSTAQSGNSGSWLSPASVPPAAQGTFSTVYQSGAPATSGTGPMNAAAISYPTAVQPSGPIAPPKRPAKRGARPWMIALIAALLVVVLGAGLGVLYLNNYFGLAGRTIVGHGFFVSSGLLAQNSSQGIADRVQLDLQGLPAPQPGKNYYAWLLSDTDSDAARVPIMLGALAVSNGHADITYPGDAQHSDLLARYSRLLITEESSNPPPSSPSLDTTTWRYYAAFSRTPNPNDTVDHYSLLDHLRHLLAQDPKLQKAGLTGGLDIWLFRNMTKILEWSGSARDAYQGGDTGLMRRQLVRILDYLDSSQFIGTEHIPADLPLIEVDPTIARVALLQFSPTQDPPGYLRHIGLHLSELTESPGVNADQQRLAVAINKAINNVQAWLLAVHSDAEQLIQMTPAQLAQPGTLAILNHLFTQANDAFVGQTDPNTNQVKEGVAQIHYDIQRLATFDITTCTSGKATNPCV